MKLLHVIKVTLSIVRPDSCYVLLRTCSLPATQLESMGTFEDAWAYVKLRDHHIGFANVDCEFQFFCVTAVKNRKILKDGCLESLKFT